MVTSGGGWWGEGELDEASQKVQTSSYKISTRGFPGGTVVKNPPANAGDSGSSTGPGRSHMLQSN